jgi:protein O-GlcNAc transferase
MNINRSILLAFEYYQAGNFQQVERICKKILKRQPENFDALQLLGGGYYKFGNYDLAIKYIKKALNFNSNSPEIHFNLGNAFLAKGQFDNAIACYQKTIKLNPNFYNAYINLGPVFQAKGKLDEAITYYQIAIELNPNLPDAYYNLGTVFQTKGQLDEAITYYQIAIKLNPDLPDTHYSLGTVFYIKGQLDEAITCYQIALKLNPYLVNAYYNLGSALQVIGRQDKALAAYDMALFFKPDFIAAQLAHCISHLLIIYPDPSSIQVSRKRYHDELIKLRDTISHEFAQDIDIAAKAVGSMQPFYLAYQGFNDRELQQLYGELVCQTMASKYPQFADHPAMPPISSEEPLRIGIVSGYFYLHSNWKIPIKGWVENLDKKRISLYGYYTGIRKDKETDIARHSFIRFVEDIYSFEDLCKTIRQDNLHILIYPEIGMDPMTAQLATVRLAPIQCSSWGHPDTSGLLTIDYFLSSNLMELPEADDHYTERLIRLPNLSVYYTPLDVPSVAINRDTFGLRPKSILYLCCQSLFKYLPQYDEVYPRIAQLVGDCQFLFISHFRSNWVTEQFRSRIQQSFNDFDLQADEYIVFLPVLDPGEYYAINSLADVYLDSIGWSGCNSTFEALACNLPVVTLPGELMRGRHSSAILTMMGLTETIATTLDEYVMLAVKLGQDSKWRRYISDKISKNKHLAYRDRACITALEDFMERAVKERL